MTRLTFTTFIAFALLPSLQIQLWTETTAAAGMSFQNVRAESGWLDRQPVNWNRRMGGLPRPVSSLGEPTVRSRCRDLSREPESPAERALVRSGWMLYGSVQSYGLTRIVTAMSGIDGMCRPLGYHAFVYWEGRYAGTLSPAAMDSRTDGSLVNIRLVSPTRIVGEFARYRASDPRCCPTRISHVTYEVSRDDSPLVTPISINTWPVGTPSEGPDAEPDRDDAGTLFGRRWMLTEIDSVAIRSAKPYIEFERESNRFSGDSGCNRISGRFERQGRNLRLSQVISTKRACLDTGDQLTETDFLRRLEQVNRFQIDGDVLRLLADRVPMLTFRSGPGDSGGQEARVSGTVSYFQRIALPPDAVVEVKLLDLSRADAAAVTIAEQTIRAAGRQVPIDFSLQYDPGRIDPRRRYSVQARILQDNLPRFVSTQPYYVITGGNPTTVNVIVRPVSR